MVDSMVEHELIFSAGNFNCEHNNILSYPGSLRAFFFGGKTVLKLNVPKIFLVYPSGTSREVAVHLGVANKFYIRCIKRAICMYPSLGLISVGCLGCGGMTHRWKTFKLCVT